MMQEKDFLWLASYMKDTYGIDLHKKKEIVEGRLEPYLHRNGYVNYQVWMEELKKKTSGRLEKELVDLLTTNHTFFMREFLHFDYMRQVVLPYLKRKEEKRKDLAIWCAAASTGQEPYMIAMLLREYFVLDYDAWDTQVLATDISEEALRKAVKGEYSREQIQELPDQWRRRFLKKMPDGEHFVVTDDIKSQVIFRKFNLMEAFPFRRKMHVIFLRNVMIYFDAKTKRELLEKIYEQLLPGGYLFIGRTESLERNYVPLEIIQPSIFRKPG